MGEDVDDPRVLEKRQETFDMVMRDFPCARTMQEEIHKAIAVGIYDITGILRTAMHMRVWHREESPPFISNKP